MLAVLPKNGQAQASGRMPVAKPSANKGGGTRCMVAPLSTEGGGEAVRVGVKS